eukprot:UN24566
MHFSPRPRQGSKDSLSSEPPFRRISSPASPALESSSSRRAASPASFSKSANSKRKCHNHLW